MNNDSKMNINRFVYSTQKFCMDFKDLLLKAFTQYHSHFQNTLRPGNIMFLPTL